MTISNVIYITNPDCTLICIYTHCVPIACPSHPTTMPSLCSSVSTTCSSLQRGDPPPSKSRRLNTDEKPNKQAKAPPEEEGGGKKEGKGGQEGKKGKKEPPRCLQGLVLPSFVLLTGIQSRKTSSDKAKAAKKLQ